VQAGALAAFLREILMSQCASAESIEGDLQRLLDIHFRDMPGLVPKEPGSLPAGALDRLQAYISSK